MANNNNLTNAQSAELFNTLNSIEFLKNSHAELASAHTLRNMKEWQVKYNEKLNFIDSDNCATYKNDRDVEILLKKTLKKTFKNKAGEDVSEEFQVNEYTKEGEKKRVEDRIKFNNAKACVDFDIYSTADDGVLSAYQKIVLKELGFLKTPEEQKTVVEKVKSKK